MTHRSEWPLPPKSEWSPLNLHANLQKILYRSRSTCYLVESNFLFCQMWERMSDHLTGNHLPRISGAMCNATSLLIECCNLNLVGNIYIQDHKENWWLCSTKHNSVKYSERGSRNICVLTSQTSYFSEKIWYNNISALDMECFRACSRNSVGFFICWLGFLKSLQETQVRKILAFCSVTPATVRILLRFVSIYQRSCVYVKS